MANGKDEHKTLGQDRMEMLLEIIHAHENRLKQLEGVIDKKIEKMVNIERRIEGMLQSTKINDNMFGEVK